MFRPMEAASDCETNSKQSRFPWNGAKRLESEAFLGEKATVDGGFKVR